MGRNSIKEEIYVYGSLCCTAESDKAGKATRFQFKKNVQLNDNYETGFCSQVVSSSYFLHETLEESFLQVNKKKVAYSFETMLISELYHLWIVISGEKSYKSIAELRKF